MIAPIPGGRDAPAVDRTPDTRGFTGLVLLKYGRDLVRRIDGWDNSGRYSKRR